MSTREVRKEGIWRQTNERKYASQRARRDEKSKKKTKTAGFLTRLDSSVVINYNFVAWNRRPPLLWRKETRRDAPNSFFSSSEQQQFLVHYCTMLNNLSMTKKIEFSLEMKVISVFISACAKRRKCFCCVAVMWARDWRINSTSSFGDISLMRLSIIQIRLGGIRSRFIDPFM